MERNENAEFVESAWDLGMIWGFSGQLKYSELFYGYYTNDTYRSMAKFSGDSDSKVTMNKIIKKHLEAVGWAGKSFPAYSEVKLSLKFF